MKPPDEVRRKFVRQWLAKAQSDLEMSRYLLAGGEAYTNGAAFHAQQSSEKYLKSLLVWHQVEFPKTHDLNQLLDLIGTFDEEVAEKLRPVTVLTSYAVELRYPDEVPEPSLDQANEAFMLAGNVRNVVFKRLPAEFTEGK